MMCIGSGLRRSDAQLKLILILFSNIAVATANAGPACSTIFHCVSTKGGNISVCDAEDSLVYSLARGVGNRVLEIRELRRNVIVERDNGIGRYREFSLGFARGEDVYSVYYNFDILGPSDPVAGVLLTKGTQLIEEIPCSSKVPVTMKFDSLDPFEEPTTDQE